MLMSSGVAGRFRLFFCLFSKLKNILLLIQPYDRKHSYNDRIWLQNIGYTVKEAYMFSLSMSMSMSMPMFMSK